MWNQFAPRLSRAVLNAVDLAGREGRDAAGAGHLFRAILRDGQSAAVYILDHAGIDSGAVASELQPPADTKARPRERAERLTPEALLVLDVAVAEARQLTDRHIGTEHVLLALTRLTDSAPGRALAGVGLTADSVLRGRSSWIAQRMPRQRKPPSKARQVLSRLLPAKVRETLLRPVERAAGWASLGHRVFVQKALGHPRYVTNPYPLYRWLRRHAPVRLDPLAGAWVVSRYADIATVLKDPRFKRDMSAGDQLPDPLREQVGLPPAGEHNGSGGVMDLQMLFLDPPRHTRVRAAFAKAFAGRTLQSLRPRIQQVTDRRLDKVAAAGQTDLIRDLAVPLPVVVIAELLGFPPEDYPRLKKWSDDFAAQFAITPDPAAAGRAGQSLGEMSDYFDAVVRDLRREPRDNLLSALLEAERETGDSAARLSRAELFANCVLLLAAGHETTTNLIGNGVLALLRHPDQLRLLRSDPSLITGAVEEMLRYDSPVQWTSRIASQDVEIDGRTIERGEFVLAPLGSANRDESQFRDPDRLDIRRPDNKHLAFGHGIHFCLGATLARLEAEVAVGTLVQRFPKLRLGQGRLKWHKGMTFRGVKALPLQV